jgi:hypothetical protein
MAKDPVCGMTVEEKTTKFKSEHDGKPSIFVHRRVNKNSMLTLTNMDTQALKV